MRRRLVLGSLAGLIVLLAAGSTALYWYLRQSLPATNGRVTVPGIAAPVDIVRDADGIPHIRGASKADVLFGLGYVHAQDRLWQMEFQRRIGHGRLSEIFGAAALPQDRFLRTVGFGRAARSAWTHLPGDTRRDIDAYVAGVNAFLASHHGRELPPEFSLLRFEPEPWSGPDVLAWVKMMAWDLSANYSSELFRHDLNAQLGAEKAAALMPPYPQNGVTIIRNAGATTAAPPDAAAIAPASGSSPLVPRPPSGATTSAAPASPASASAAFAEAMTGLPAVRAFLIGGARTEALGSNNWVVDGTLTASGKPLLANDPHLGTHIPSLWYLAHMTAGDFDVIGATLPGAPAVAIGRNRHIAWGETNVGADVQDLYREKLDAAGRSAEFRGRFEPLRIVREKIAVKGAEAVVVDVRISRHGPLVSDAINANNAAVNGGPARPPLDPFAFRWTALDDEDTTIAAFLKLNTARDWTGFVEAMRDFVTPSQNFVYADVDGHIGYFAPGRIPVRASGDGTAPAVGWSGEQEWIGWIPFEQLPQLFDPPDHQIVTANHRPNPQADPRNIAVEYPEPYRAERIAALLAHRKGLTPDDFQRMQADTYSLHAQTLLPVLLRHVDAVDDEAREALELLRTWDYDAARDSAAAAIFQVWFLQLAPAIVGDDLGPQLLDNYQGRYSFITRFLLATLGSDPLAWCDNTTTPVAETCRQAVTSAFQRAVGIVQARLGKDVRAWKWGDLHPAVFPHQGLDGVALLRPILNRSIANGGDWSTVNVGAVAADHQFEQRAVPGYRHIVDLSPANDSRFQDAVGQSGHFLSSGYDDFIESWQEVRHRPMRMEPSDVERGMTGWLRLVPAAAAR